MPPTIANPDDLSSWSGVLTGVKRGSATLTARAYRSSYDDGTHASLVLTSNRQPYWIKVLGNPQGDQILVTEAVVSGVGELIDAPVRPTALIEVPPTLAGFEYAKAYRFHAGIAHGSLHLEHAEEGDKILYPRRDGNPSRRACLAALWDWCMGDDEQWLYDLDNDYSIWSFDHGFWFGGDGGMWDTPMLERLVDHPWPWTEATASINPESLTACAARIRGVTAADILRIIARVPLEWGTPNSDLETLGWFLHRRKSGVADRLDVLASDIDSKQRKD
ncbi:hypothetical protein [Agromyces mariniharenae]|uniref:Uncharacterized protein n=1 Tax=Agromyces mariniharenae TaxID=2604423 RepID=A0A5S4UV84_9MICO|nr:hypothetical protein [Agromyces mariniharenae]TYL50476.1 hypothetical protein FYC51_14840 [Agromyces mariniharenae]